VLAYILIGYVDKLAFGKRPEKAFRIAQQLADEQLPPGSK